MTEIQKEIIATPFDRLDNYLVSCLPTVSRSRIQALIKTGEITVDNKMVKPSLSLNGGESIAVNIPAASPLNVAAEDIALNILYEDEDIIVIDKPQNMVVHPANGHSGGTLVNALLHHCQNLSGINGVMRPGIVHRIDKDTSGVLVVAKNDEAHLGLTQQWQGHHITRIYVALLVGVVPEQAGTVDAPIGRHPRDRKKMAVTPGKGKNAITHYKILERFKGYSLAELQLDTGRTHQIRVHMSYLGHPVAGDVVYGSKKNELNLQGQALHAQVLGLNHPRTGVYMEFKSDLPAYFTALLEKLRANS